MGEIPEHWEVKPGFTVLRERKDKNTGMKSDNVLSLSYGRIIEKPIGKLTGLVPENFETYQLVSPGDIIFRPTDLQNDKVSLRTGLSMFTGIITSAYINLQPVNADPQFLHYFLHTTDTNKVIYGLGSGLRQNISYLDFKRFLIGIPPIQEQESIAKFLDNKCKKIEAAVILKEQQIEKLKELRQITIHNAFTKGVSHLKGEVVSVKDSGIDWIGEIPEHWEVKRLKNVLIERNERSQLGTEPLFMMSQIHGLVLRKDYHEKEEVAKSAEGNKLVYQNDLVFNKLKPHLGVFYKNKLDTVGIVSPDYAVYYSDTLDDIIFLEYLFRIPEYISQFKIKATGIVEGLIRLYTSDLFSIHVAIPPLSEQQEIVTYLENQTSKIDQAIAQKQQQIIKLKEYKQSLINEVVTGKIKVTL